MLFNRTHGQNGDQTAAIKGGKITGGAMRRNSGAACQSPPTERRGLPGASPAMTRRMEFRSMPKWR